jgi:hypothetical protein
LKLNVPLPPPYPAANVSFRVTDPEGVRPAMLCAVGAFMPEQPAIAATAAKKLTLIDGARWRNRIAVIGALTINSRGMADNTAGIIVVGGCC